MVWNPCSLCRGITIHFAVEWLFSLRGIRNLTHFAGKFSMTVSAVERNDHEVLPDARDVFDSSIFGFARAHITASDRFCIPTVLVAAQRLTLSVPRRSCARCSISCYAGARRSNSGGRRCSPRSGARWKTATDALMRAILTGMMAPGGMDHLSSASFARECGSSSVSGGGVASAC